MTDGTTDEERKPIGLGLTTGVEKQVLYDPAVLETIGYAELDDLAERGVFSRE
jgi:hypothetical protein